MRIRLLGAGKKNALPSPMLGIADRPQRSIQPFESVRSRRFPGVDRAEPPILRAILADAGKQKIAAIGRPNRIAAKLKRRLDAARLAPLRRDNEDLTEAEARAGLVRSALSEEGDPFAVRREPRSPSVFCDQLWRDAAGDGQNVDSASVKLRAVGDQPVIRREVRIAIVKVAASQPNRIAGADGPSPYGEIPTSFAIGGVSREPAVVGDSRGQVKTGIPRPQRDWRKMVRGRQGLGGIRLPETIAGR